MLASLINVVWYLFRWRGETPCRVVQYSVLLGSTPVAFIQQTTPHAVPGPERAFIGCPIAPSCRQGDTGDPGQRGAPRPQLASSRWVGRSCRFFVAICHQLRYVCLVVLEKRWKTPRKPRCCCYFFFLVGRFCIFDFCWNLLEGRLGTHTYTENLQMKMDPSDDANAAASTSFETSSSVTSNQVVDNTDAVNAGGSATCLCGHRVGSSGEPHISVTVAPTTGGQFEIKVSKSESIDSLKKTISKRLKVPKERICLLWKDRYTWYFINLTVTSVFFFF